MSRHHPSPFANIPRWLLLVAWMTVAGCTAARHGRPIIDNGDKPPSAGGTIAGLVTEPGNVALTGRKVTVTNVSSGVRFEATTATNGGYTIQVPKGTYRIEVEVRAGETVTTHPGNTDVNEGDLDEAQNFVITAGQK